MNCKSLYQAASIFAAMMISTNVAALPENGHIDKAGNELRVWSQAQQSYVTPESYFEAEVKKLNGPTYGRTHQYPEYETVKDWETLIDVLPNGKGECPMVFFHQRWRRLPDVLALHEDLRNYGGCRYVFDE
ncbi:Uncharacterised protein [BD1-7 clade bacterium]|uniref:Uncharacterized protein n=1 Tax=BD1-7 clade bacterium TaxID=2029982 RepID=A0A5S9NRB6_9GAMM|nr:Uncharacterised protein [BD1-7 clade bacterium]CAA0093087.1 Uncharacterised protein [BD1-7 clade bacterium]